jgi:hypothetical protein
VTANEAKRIIKNELDNRGLAYTKLTARTVSFVDLARASCIFVCVHGWQPNPQWAELRRIAVEHSFRIETLNTADYMYQDRT